MINPIDYLYYKIYKGISYINGGGYPMTQIGATNSILIANYLIISYLILGGLKEEFIIAGGIIIIVLSVIYFSIREKSILAKYEKESEKSRKVGNWIVIGYIVLSALAFYMVLSFH